MIKRFCVYIKLNQGKSIAVADKGRDLSKQDGDLSFEPNCSGLSLKRGDIMTRHYNYYDYFILQHVTYMSI